MNTDLIHSLTANFEVHAQQTETGVEYWLARDIQHLLGYVQWRNFLLIVSKAKTACGVSGNQASDHFADVRKMVDLGSGGKREIDDFAVQDGFSDAGGISSCSRWLSAATPPVQYPNEIRTPAGVPASQEHGLRKTWGSF